MTVKKIGILHGMERTFPEAFIASVNARNVPGVIAEEISLGGTSTDELKDYTVIVDRISHEIKYYRGYLKLAALNGTRVINNPYWWSADDKFSGTALAQRLGLAVPKTVLLPNCTYPDGVTERSLHNLRYPLDWEAMLRYVGLPAIIKPAEGGGGKSVSKVHSVEELWEAFNRSGETQMMLQECIEWDHYVRCLCIGKQRILPIKWHPPFGRPMGIYFVDHNHLTPELGSRIVSDAQKLNEALGYDMNTVEFAVRDGIPYAIDFTNPAPDFDLNSITPHYFGIVVEWMTDLVLKLAEETQAPQANLKWWSLMGWSNPEEWKVPTNGNGAHAEPAAATAVAEPQVEVAVTIVEEEQAVPVPAEAVAVVSTEAFEELLLVATGPEPGAEATEEKPKAARSRRASTAPKAPRASKKTDK